MSMMMMMSNSYVYAFRVISLWSFLSRLLSVNLAATLLLITPICFYSFRFCGVTAPRVSLEDLHNDVHQYQVTLYRVIIGELECAVFRYCTPARGGPCWAVLGRALLQIKNKIVGDYNQLAAGFRGTRVTRAATVARRAGRPSVTISSNATDGQTHL